MTSLHYLNVGAGDCTLIQHSSGRVSMIDICGGNLPRKRNVLGLGDALAGLGEAGALSRALGDEFAGPAIGGALGGLGLPRGGGLLGALGNLVDAPRGNFNMDAQRTNPLEYMEQNGITEVYRFISTHPEMDHLDGLDALFRAIPVHNFWHTGVIKPDTHFAQGSPYKKEDWDRYLGAQRGESPYTTVLRKRTGSMFSLANQEENGSAGGDGLYILAPDEALVQQAELAEDMNEASYILLLITSAGSVVISGDAHDASWNFVLQHYRQSVENCALLIAPHHGRDSDRDYAFLDVLRPRLTLMGVAPSEHMGYGSWNRRNLPFITNNQAGSIRVDIDGSRLSVWVENERYASARGFSTDVRNAQGFVGVGLY